MQFAIGQLLEVHFVPTESSNKYQKHCKMVLTHATKRCIIYNTETPGLTFLTCYGYRIKIAVLDKWTEHQIYSLY